MSKHQTACFALTLFAFALLSLNASAQVIIPESALTDRLGSTIETKVFETESAAGLNALVAASGANQVWDFSVIDFPDSLQLSLSYVNLPADLPGSDLAAFSGATFVEYAVSGIDDSEVEILLYQSIENGNVLSYGDVIVATENGMRDTLITRADPPALDGLFPVEFENSWRDSTSYISGNESAITYQITEVTIDGWGPLVTPAGSVPALRLYNLDRTYLIAGNQLLSEEVNLDFISAEGITANIELDDMLAPASASFAVENNTMSLDRVDESIPESFRLSQNFPNPFNPVTTIAYAIPRTSNVNIKIFTLTGQLVKTIIDEVQPAGSYETRFDASGLASGLYLYKLESGSFIETRLMSLIK